MSTNPNLDGPQFVQYFGPLLDALRKLGGSARPAEVRDQIADDLHISEESQSEILESGTPRYDNQIAWSRFYLARAGLIDSSERGVWTLTDEGRATELSHQDALSLFREIHSQFQKEKQDSAVEESDDADAPPPDSSEAASNHQEQLLDTLLSLPAAGFERFCQRLLRESGFQDVKVTGRSGDGGIDGIGILQVNALVSFKVLFQCKRYQGSVSPSQIRDFRGAMQGRADKGIVITTGTFTRDSKREAVRDGVPPIELVDGEKLVEMMEELELGLKPIKAFSLDHEFFDSFRD